MNQFLNLHVKDFMKNEGLKVKNQVEMRNETPIFNRGVD